jgi:hypothetical protein
VGGGWWVECWASVCAGEVPLRGWEFEVSEDGGNDAVPCSHVGSSATDVLEIHALPSYFVVFALLVGNKLPLKVSLPLTRHLDWQLGKSCLWFLSLEP